MATVRLPVPPALANFNPGPSSGSSFGTPSDPMVGQRVGGVNVFGGGLALYRSGVKVGGVGVSGDTSCTDHMVAWRVRNASLERRVEERTSELADANKRLVAEKLERAQIDLRFQKLQNELFHAARLTAAGQMAAALAHELNQPLTAVVNSVNAAKRLLSREGRVNLLIAQEITGEAAEQALRASKIVRSLRQFLVRDEKERQIEVLPAMIEEAGALALRSIAPLTVRLTFEFDGCVRGVLVNRVQIQQVIVNLIRNAFEAMADQESREVTLTTRTLGDGTIEVAVADIGTGISGDIAGRLFEPFVSTKHDGMGLGLSISRSIIEAHDGQLTAGPNPGGGTVFRFTLPSDGVVDAG
jgi:C4-dicarboxylate-specific signal transduction histidine kinase